MDPLPVEGEMRGSGLLKQSQTQAGRGEEHGMSQVKIRRALLSVSDKRGLADLARRLSALKIELVSTGGTHRALVAEGLKVTEVSALTGSPEILDGRVKTLHPNVHGGILFRRDLKDHVATVEERKIAPIDMVVVNLYPFEETVARPGIALEDAIEQIDIGGPSMIRSAAKNASHVAVVTDPDQYAEVLAALEEGKGSLGSDLLRRLGVSAFARTADYDRAIHAYLSQRTAGPEKVVPQEKQENDSAPQTLSVSYPLHMTLRYGENPHQKAAFYRDPEYQGPSIAGARQIHGKELSYNNILDADAALAAVLAFEKPSVVVVKHNNPCGAASSDQLVDAFSSAWEGDPQSAFGSVIALNREIDEKTAELMSEPGRFVEAIIAPSFCKQAVEILTTRPSWKKNVRLLEVGALQADTGSTSESRSGPRSSSNSTLQQPFDFRSVAGGALWQSADRGLGGFDDWRVVTKRAPTEQELRDLSFSWSIVTFVKSNAIVVARDESTVGIGAGQMSRVDAVEIACRKAGDRAQKAVLASDAFFPFDDNVKAAAKAGITAIIQPGGSLRDQDSIDACDEHNIAMLFTGKRHFRH